TWSNAADQAQKCRGTLRSLLASSGAGTTLVILCLRLAIWAAVRWNKRGPSIVTPPKDIWNVTGAQIYLSCEVIGIPTPVLIWNKIIRGQYGVQRMELLPGDRENLAIQTRGGPEKHEVTGWVLVSTVCEHRAAQAAESKLLMDREQ
uniref:Ig-like domain-containing protein n=1 Tax=Zonotrichia albicollis TaxID=44394 RepID=A0A8D2NBU3_ZONAL